MGRSARDRDRLTSRIRAIAASGTNCAQSVAKPLRNGGFALTLQSKKRLSRPIAKRVAQGYKPGVAMDEVEVAGAEVELPLETAGAQLRRARAASGASLAQIAGLTRIGERQLAALEVGDYAGLPGRTYAIGFSRSFARAVGLDQNAIAARVRAELDEQEPSDSRRTVQSFEPGDPARVPTARLALIAFGAMVVAVVLGMIFFPGTFSPGGSLPSILPGSTPSPAAIAGPTAPAPAAITGPVVFTALEPDLWVKFYDTAGVQLLQKRLAKGESWTVPTDKGEVLIWTARPQALAITVGGQAVPKLADVQMTIKDVPVSAAALLARAAPPRGLVPAPAATTTSAPRRTEQRSPAAPAREQRVPRPRIEASPAPIEPSGTAPTPVPAPSAT